MNRVNVFGSFTQALFFSGITPIPKYLLSHYADLGLSDQEFLALIHIINEADTNPYPSIELLAKRLRISTIKMQEIVNNLMERKFLTIEKHWNYEHKKWYKSYSFVGLIEELADFWAIERVKEIELEQDFLNQEDDNDNSIIEKQAYERIIKLFEQELGRPLTGLECENLNQWFLAYSEELIIEALKRGVNAGIRNFRYLDSILREWEKKGLKTKAEVEKDDMNFKQRHDKKIKSSKDVIKRPHHDKYENFYY